MDKEKVINELVDQAISIYQKCDEAWDMVISAREKEDEVLEEQYFEEHNKFYSSLNTVMDIVENLDIWDEWEIAKIKKEKDIKIENQSEEEREHVKWFESRYPFLK